MRKKQEIFESRRRLDNTLSLPDLMNEDSIASLIKEQLIQSSLRSNTSDVGKIVGSRTSEVANFLEMLRSASGSDNSDLKFLKDWKVKQDTDQLRVMYCEGPHGSPFHTLLAEGFADGPMDVCLCVSWELSLYKKWWPQYNIPTFKIIASSCLQKVRTGEEISLIRMKVPWPVSDREAILHYFEIEYIKEDLILVLIKTLSDMENMDADSHGFSSDKIPKAKDTIRVDLVGGFVLQKVHTDRCYFRAIFNFDMKLDFIPPSLINFISRQLIGNGHKLYQKAVGSVATADADYREALRGPLYVRVRRLLHSRGGFAASLEDLNKGELEEHKTGAAAKDRIVEARASLPEITEEDAGQSSPDTGAKNIIASGSADKLVLGENYSTSKANTVISSEVEYALGILEEAITIVRSRNFGKSSNGVDFPTSKLLGEASHFKYIPESSSKVTSTDTSEESPHTDDHSESNIISSVVEAGRDESPTLRTQKESFSDLNNSLSSDSKVDFPSKSYVRMIQPAMLDGGNSKVCDEESLKANGLYRKGRTSGGNTKKKKGKKGILCCVFPSFLEFHANGIRKDLIK